MGNQVIVYIQIQRFQNGIPLHTETLSSRHGSTQFAGKILHFRTVSHRKQNLVRYFSYILFGWPVMHTKDVHR